METRPYEPFNFNHCATIDAIGLIKVSRLNYEALRKNTHPQIYYNEAMNVLMIDSNLVTIDDELADDVASYLPTYLPKPPEETTLFIPTRPLAPPIRPIEPIRLLDIVL